MYHSVLCLSSTFFRNFSNPLLFRTRSRLARTFTCYHIFKSLSSAFSKFSLEEHRLAADANSFMLPHVFVLVKHFFQKFSGRLAVFPSASVLSPKRSVNIPDTAPLVNYFFRLFPFSLSGGQMSAEAPLAAHWKSCYSIIISLPYHDRGRTDTLCPSESRTSFRPVLP